MTCLSYQAVQAVQPFPRRLSVSRSARGRASIRVLAWAPDVRQPHQPSAAPPPPAQAPPLPPLARAPTQQPEATPAKSLSPPSSDEVAETQEQPLASPSPSNAKARHLPSSLYAAFPRLPPDGATLTPEEEFCKPDEQRCRQPIHVWEARCETCSGTGAARSYGGSRGRGRGSRSSLATCLVCHGLGYVRHSTTRADKVPYVNGKGPNTTLGRPRLEEQGQTGKAPRRLFRWPGSGGGSNSSAKPE